MARVFRRAFALFLNVSRTASGENRQNNAGHVCGKGISLILLKLWPCAKLEQKISSPWFCLFAGLDKCGKEAFLLT
jgi:hypothetical protein